jgi:ATP-dependent helicase HrpA
MAAGMAVRAWPAFVVGQAAGQGPGQGKGQAAGQGKGQGTGQGPAGGAGTATPAVRPVALRVLATQAEQVAAHAAGVRELLLHEVGLATGRITTRWTGAESLTLATSPYPTTDALVADLQRAAIDAVAAERGVDLGTVRDGDAYATLRSVLRDALEGRTYTVARDVVGVLTAARELDAALRGTTSLALLAVVHDVRGQLADLVHDGFVAEAGAVRLPQIVRYLRAARHRLAKAAENPARDESLARQVADVLADYDDAVAAARTAAPDAVRDERLRQARWLIEELRVSLFAQHLGTPVPVSAKRVRALLT